MGEEDILDFVLTRLRQRTVPLTQIAVDAGVSYFTLQKWVRSAPVRSPRIDSLQKVATYFRRAS